MQIFPREDAHRDPFARGKFNLILAAPSAAALGEAGSWHRRAPRLKFRALAKFVCHSDLCLAAKNAGPALSDARVGGVDLFGRAGNRDTAPPNFSDRGGRAN